LDRWSRTNHDHGRKNEINISWFIPGSILEQPDITSARDPLHPVVASVPESPNTAMAKNKVEDKVKCKSSLRESSAIED
jgi:hypothetical protein